MSPRPAGAAANGLAPGAPAAPPPVPAPAPNGEDASAAEGVANGEAAGAPKGLGVLDTLLAVAPKVANGDGAGAPAVASCFPKGDGVAEGCFLSDGGEHTKWRRAEKGA